jgi:hypothetical protein
MGALVTDPFFPLQEPHGMTIPNAEQIEGAGDAIRADPAAAADFARCAKELHVGNPAFLRGLEPREIAAYAYFLGLKVAKYMLDSGARL